MYSWINFRQLRQQLDFRAVLQHYGVVVRPRTNSTQHHGFCPLPTHRGKRRSPSFSAHLTKGIWHCFGCGAKGTVLDFAVYMEGLNPSNTNDLRHIATILWERLAGGSSLVKSYSTDQRYVADTPAPETAPETVIVNAPLTFTLKNLIPNHAYLRQRGFRQETMTFFGVGYCAHGSLEGRIAIPLHDLNGRLVGYVGRIVDDSAIGEEHPKYKFPSGRSLGDRRYVLRKSLLLYNAHRIARPVKELIVVEGFAAVWWIWQAGYQNAVAIMGANCSDTQAQMILSFVSADGRVLIMSDGDAAGLRCAENLHSRLARHRVTTWIKLDEGKQPTDYSSDELSQLLNGGNT
jgi:DNA primase